MENLVLTDKEPVRFEVDTHHTQVGFKVKHMGFATVNGKFDNYSASFEFSDKTNKLRRISAKIDLASINTNQPDRDKHLRSADFFNVMDEKGNVNESNRYMTFSCEKVDYENNKPVRVHGKLTINGITKSIVLNVSYSGPGKDPYGKTRIGFEVTTEVNRQDFNIRYSAKVPGGDFVVADRVSVIIEGEAVQV